MAETGPDPLAGLTVLDVATIYAGPFAATFMGDFGAEVIKVEHPRGEPLRTHGAQKDDHGLWWKQRSCNKRWVALNRSRLEYSGGAYNNSRPRVWHLGRRSGTDTFYLRMVRPSETFVNRFSATLSPSPDICEW